MENINQSSNSSNTAEEKLKEKLKDKLLKQLTSITENYKKKYGLTKHVVEGKLHLLEVMVLHAFLQLFFLGE